MVCPILNIAHFATRRMKQFSTSCVHVFSRQFWHQLLRRFGLPDVAPQPCSVRFFDWWQQAGSTFNKDVGQGFNSLVMLGAWILWKERNDIVFNGVSPRLDRALLLAQDEADHWMLAGAKGLRGSAPAAAAVAARGPERAGAGGACVARGWALERPRARAAARRACERECKARVRRRALRPDRTEPRALRPDRTEGCARPRGPARARRGTASCARAGTSSGATSCLRAGAAWAVRVGRREQRQRTRVVVASHLWWFWSFCALVMVRPASSPGALIELEQDPALAALVRNWDFSPGKRFGTEVLQRFSTSVHHPSPTPDGSFFLLAVFRRYLFHLTEDSVAMALHCCLGGSPAGFHVVFESDRHYRFSVSNKQVGFLIRSLKQITTEQFDVYFHLWHDGGANWVKEKIKWQKEEENSWTIQTNRKNKRNSARKKVSFHHKLIQDSPITKSQPRELNSEFGTDSSQFNKDFHKGPRSSSGSNRDVPVYSVFQKLKRDLRIDENGGRSNCPMQYKEAINGNAPQGDLMLPAVALDA
ncbi:uncharacterized protein [Miscanthus floridulus]|uniref:uncharacterized protein n=1 Tax=Miscanthus floridulus TaxID=154761 RepID=UPI003459CA32